MRARWISLALGLVVLAVALPASAETAQAAAADAAEQSPMTATPLPAYRHLELGNAAFAENDFASAARHYADALAQRHSAGAHYNRANALYKQGRTAEAIVHYRRALWLEPRRTDLRESLRMAEGTARVPGTAAGPVGWTARLLPAAQWPWVAAVASWLALAVLGLALVRRQGWARAIVVATVALLVTAVAVTSMAWWRAQAELAIVLQDDMKPRLAPAVGSPRAEVAPVLRAGRALTIVRQHGNFLELAEGDTVLGWYAAETEAAAVVASRAAAPQ